MYIGHSGLCKQQRTEDTVDYLRGYHAPEKQKRHRKQRQEIHGKSAWVPNLKRRQSEHHVDSTTIEDLEKWEQEEQTWHLLEVILQIEHPLADTEGGAAPLSGRLARPSKGTEIHQYSSEHDVWSHFLAHDDQAWERSTIVEWLKVCADDSGQGIEHVIQDLEENADRGSGLWAHSWLYTKEAIKAQKRLRSWPQALAPDSPGIDSSLRNPAQTTTLVTQLDPDAVTRQARGLEPQDDNFERATWMACWTMLRRGQDWQFIRSWCQERVENWRAISMRGDHRQYTVNDGQSLPCPDRNASWQSGALWRKACAAAARTGDTDQYEAAVYGALSGYLPSVQKVCGGWNDYLFAHYNSYLLRSFDQYIATNLTDRLPPGLLDRGVTLEFSMTGGRRTQSGKQLIEKMKRLKPLASEARDLMKQLQGSLIGKSFDSFVRKHGFQLMEERNRQSKQSKAPDGVTQTPTEDSKSPLIRPDDYQLIRMITHISLIYQDFEFSSSNTARNKAAAVFIEAYIDFLGGAGKQQLLPLYASRLPPERAIQSLSRQLPRILEYAERRTVMQLMRQHGIDVPSVLNEQLWMIMKRIEENAEEDTNGADYPTLHVLTDDQRIGLRGIREAFMGNVITDDQNDLINGFEWYMLLDGYWEKTLATGAVLYKHFLKLPHSQGLAAARELSQRVAFSTLSRKKTNAILGTEVDFSHVFEQGEDGTLTRQGTAIGRARASKYAWIRLKAHNETEKERYLMQRSNSFQNFEQLLHLLDALERWQVAMDKKPRTELAGPLGKKWREQLKEALEVVEGCIQPLLHGWLQQPRDDNEASELEQIRKACLPEVVLAYIAVLNSSAQFLSRELLLKSLEMGAMVASK
ncbi:MAG: hypothetical protein Q9207_004660, partial [Kuettlingeria erythrocarpa]